MSRKTTAPAEAQTDIVKKLESMEAHEKRLAEKAAECGRLEGYWEAAKETASVKKKQLDEALRELRLLCEGPPPLFAEDGKPASENADNGQQTLRSIGVPPNICAILEGNTPPIVTVGDLKDWTDAGRDLTQIAKIGQTKARRIEQALADWSGRPPAPRPANIDEAHKVKLRGLIPDAVTDAVNKFYGRDDDSATVGDVVAACDVEGDGWFRKKLRAMGCTEEQITDAFNNVIEVVEAVGAAESGG